MFEKFRNNFSLNDDKWNDYTSCFKRMEVPAKTILLKENEVSKRLFLIEKGCIRVWFNNDGKEVSSQFFFENQMVASIESFKKGLPSPVFIETIEPCIVWCLYKKDAERIIAEIVEMPALRDKYIDGIFERSFHYIKHFASFIRDSPEQRYLNLIKDNPTIIQRVPQHYIASYLGISTVHLSRIKSKLQKKNKHF